MDDRTALFAIRLLHTVIWFVIGGAVVAIPVAALMDALFWGWVCGVVALGETAVLFLNRMRCPLTAVAARHTSEREPGFDIFIPGWIARNNAWIFGPIMVAGLAMLVWRTFVG